MMETKNLESLHKGELTPAVSYVKIAAIVTVIVSIIGGGIIAFILYRETLNLKDTEREIEVASSHVPESYYPLLTRAELKEKATQPNHRDLVSNTVYAARGSNSTLTPEQQKAVFAQQTLVNGSVNHTDQTQSDNVQSTATQTSNSNPTTQAINGNTTIIQNADASTPSMQTPSGAFVDYVSLEQKAEAKRQEAKLQKKIEAQTNDAKLTANEAFVKDKIDYAKELQRLRREKLLSRRGKESGDWNVIEVPSIVQERAKEAKELKDTDFSSQDMDKDVSTYPVDLSRTVTADRYIPCILVDQINSQLAGRVTCTVERNVYGYHGRNILIPAGSKFMGSHGTLKKIGDERFNIQWKRLLRPDGVHIKTTDAYATDQVGATGIEGEVNRRNLEKYGGALLTSTISVLAQISIPSKGTNITNTVAESFSTDIGRVTAAMLNENINIKPYSIVPAGERILVAPVTDIWLKGEGDSLSFKAIKAEETN